MSPNDQIGPVPRRGPGRPPKRSDDDCGGGSSSDEERPRERDETPRASRLDQPCGGGWRVIRKRVGLS